MSGYEQHETKGPVNKISPEETQSLKRCLDESFLTHSVPGMLVAFAGMRYLKYKGYQVGVLAQAATIGGTGIAARLSVVPDCLEKTVKAFPEGTLAAELKNARDRRFKTKSPEFSPPESYSHEQMPAMEYEPVPTSQPSASGQYPPTYDDLRRKNREQYMGRRTAQPPPLAPTPPPAYQPEQSGYPEPPPTGSSYSDPPSPYSDHTPLIPPSYTEDEPKVRRRKRINKYGDEIED